MTFKSNLGYNTLPVLLAATIIWTLSLVSGATAQSLRTIDAGTTIDVRTSDEINAASSDGRVFSGVVDRDVLGRGGSVAIPKGANVELLVKGISKDEVALDLESVEVKGQRYGIQTQDSVVSSEAEGVGANKRTGEFVGGGAMIGAIIGAIAGGGKGAAIGGGIGAAAGASTQVLTRGRQVNIPAESVVTFRLDRPLQIDIADSGFSHNGQHYHPGYGTNSGDSAAYQDGVQAGRSDSDRNLGRNERSNRWSNSQDIRDYQAGYDKGYRGDSRNVEPRANVEPRVSNVPQRNISIKIGSDHNISWQGPADSKVYVQVDNNPRQLFAGGAAGTQLAPWITSGHLYVFVLQDANGIEIARDQSDLRPKRNPL